MPQRSSKPVAIAFGFSIQRWFDNLKKFYVRNNYSMDIEPGWTLILAVWGNERDHPL